MLSVCLESQLKTMALAGGVAASEGIPVHMGRRPGDSRGRAHPLPHGPDRAAACGPHLAGAAADAGA